MIIFFEGVDKTGKTSIAKELSRVINIPYFKNNTEKKFFSDVEVSKYRWLDQLYLYEFLKQTHYSAIIDRGYASDIVYTNVFRRDNLDIINILYDIDYKFSSIGARIIYCYKDEILEKDDIINIVDNKRELESEYAYFLLKTKCKYLELNTTDEALEKQITIILGWLYE